MIRKTLGMIVMAVLCCLALSVVLSWKNETYTFVSNQVLIPSFSYNHRIEITRGDTRSIQVIATMAIVGEAANQSFELQSGDEILVGKLFASETGSNNYLIQLDTFLPANNLSMKRAYNAQLSILLRNREGQSFEVTYTKDLLPMKLGIAALIVVTFVSSLLILRVIPRTS